MLRFMGCDFVVGSPTVELLTRIEHALHSIHQRCLVQWPVGRRSYKPSINNNNNNNYYNAKIYRLWGWGWGPQTMTG